ncbi:hypothetical protein [Streptomyces sp. AS58]|uniref:hypothetical protein n=1 Tax=Streptomyces sp. AS58 TaxID=1519489 RepID=UPI0006AE68E4|nr:hypothetical protein [Streptomyces sp. AS58]
MFLPPPTRARECADRAFDAALDDTELGAARTALAQGRWQVARSLLARTGDDWDRRGHRVTVLALEPYSAAWAHEWLAAEPGSADAAVLLALAQVRRALRRKGTPDCAREACRAAVALAPVDPTPWLGLLMLERPLGTRDAVVRAFEQVRARCADHHHAHHLMVARLAEEGADGPDPAHEVYDFADRAARRAPADSPLAVLPVVARAERYRALATSGCEPPDPAASDHWCTRGARRVMSAAFDWWLEWEQDGHPRRLVDLNYLAHAKYCEGRDAEAAALFQRIGDHVTARPWSYPDRAAHAAFRAARDRALGVR